MMYLHYRYLREISLIPAHFSFHSFIPYEDIGGGSWRQCLQSSIGTSSLEHRGWKRNFAIDRYPENLPPCRCPMSRFAVVVVVVPLVWTLILHLFIASLTLAFYSRLVIGRQLSFD